MRKLLNIRSFDEWVKDAPKPQTPEPAKVKPFILRNMPKVQKKINLPKSAALLERWLNAEAYVGPTFDEELRGTRFKVGHVDTETIKINWLLTYPLVARRFDELKDKLRTEKALNVVGKRIAHFLKNRLDFSGRLDVWSACGADMQELHHLFQFQLSTVKAWDGIGFLELEAITDVTGTLASFSFNAAVAYADINTKTYYRYPSDPSGLSRQSNLRCWRSHVKVTHVYLYAKDSFTFHDIAGQPSQYLGHWNDNGVIIAAGSAIADILGLKSKLSDATITKREVVTADEGKSTTINNTYYEIRNRHFNAWRSVNKKGGDFVIYSDRLLYKLPQPIEFTLPEQCFPVKTL